MSRQRKQYVPLARIRREQFLEHLRAGDPVILAVEKIGVSRRNAYTHRDSDAEFRQAWDDALEDWRQTDLARMEREADRRGREGWLEPVYQHGKMVGAKRKFSDALLLARMRAIAPEKYRDRVDVTSGDQAIKPGVIVVGQASRTVDDWEDRFGDLTTPDDASR